ncbi:MAG: hypothetical protein LBB07_01470, partial [Bifidobacteriaceae bacterium]|nr:hypothetical protein [Bifidobacteriaceae bacterium]
MNISIKNIISNKNNLPIKKQFQKLCIFIFAFAFCFTGFELIKISSSSNAAAYNIEAKKEAKSIQPSDISEIGYDGYFQGGWRDNAFLAGAGTINTNGLSGIGSLTAGSSSYDGDRLRLGKAGTISDGGVTHLGWRVLGVGSIAPGTFGIEGFKSHSTSVSENSAFILSEDQVSTTKFGESAQNWFEKNNGTIKNTIAAAGESFLTGAGNFTNAEQNAILPKQLNGVCTGGAAGYGCADYANYGADTTVAGYKFYPLSFGDFAQIADLTDEPCANGKFFSSSANCTIQNGDIPTSENDEYWMRSAERDDTRVTISVSNVSGKIANRSFSYSPLAYRPAAQIDLNKVILTQRLKNGSIIGGDIPLSRWQGAENGKNDKKLVLQDESVNQGIFKNNGVQLDSSSSLTIGAGGKISLTMEGAPSSDKAAYKIISRGHSSDSAAGSLVAAGEGGAASLTIDGKYNFWNSDIKKDFELGSSYDLYLWTQRDSSTTSDLGSPPLKVTLNVAHISPQFGNDGFFQGGKAVPSTINLNGVSGATTGLTTAANKLHFGTAGSLSDGGVTHKG